jgi:chromosomal replication initiator protein
MKETPLPYVAAGQVVTVPIVEQAVAQIWEVNEQELYKKRRFREVVEPRQVVFHYRVRYMKHTPRRVAAETAFNTATVYHAEKTVDNLIETDPEFRKKHKLLMEKLG